jgi:integrase
LVTGGGYAEYCLATASQCLPIPEGLSLIQAAAIPEAFFTVWSNIFDRARLLPYETLLVHGGTSGIGTTAIQLAKSFHSKVIITALIEDIRLAKLNSGVKNATVNRTLALLRAVLRSARDDWDWLDQVPTIKILPEANKRLTWLTHEAAERLLSELPLHLNAMARFALATGLRASNVTGLQWSQVDMVRKCAWVHADEAKSNKSIGIHSIMMP